MIDSYSDIMAHLDKLGLFHMDMSLDRMRAAVKALDLENPGFAVIQVVGTNGKGSTSSFLAAMAEKHGLVAGLYTSPHFVSPRERIMVNGRRFSEADWVAPARLIRQKAPELTYFEFLTVLALLLFRESGVDLAIMEAGLGGRFDATTAARADLVCFTPVDMDHEAVLGNTLAAIAGDKAEAMRPGAPAVSAPQKAEARAALARAATEKGVELEFCAPLAGPPLGLRGPHQAVNAGVAVAAWKAFCRLRGMAAEDGLIARGLASAFIPGRLQLVPAHPQGAHGWLLLDGAHNPAGLAALEETAIEGCMRPVFIIFSCLADKDVINMSYVINRMLDRLGNDATVIIPAIADNPRAAVPADLAELLRGRGRPVSNLGEALELARSVPSSNQNPHVLCGSLYLLAEFYAMWPQYLSNDMCYGLL